MRGSVEPTVNRMWIVWVIIFFILALVLAWVLLGWSTPLGYADGAGAGQAPASMGMG